MRPRAIPFLLVLFMILQSIPLMMTSGIPGRDAGEFPRNHNIQDYEPSTDEQWDLDVTISSDGRFFAVWADDRLLYSDIRFSKSQNGSSWGDGLFNNNDITVNSDSGEGREHWHPSITVDAMGRLYSIWLDDGADGNRLMFATSNNSGNLWTPAAPITDGTTEGGDISEPYIRWSPASGLIVIYVLEHNATGGGRLQKDISMIRSTDGGETFSDPIILNDDDTNEDQFHPRMTVSTDGEAAVIWEDYRNGDSVSGRNGDIYLAVISGNGVPGKNIRVGREGEVEQQNPDVAFSQRGDILAAWQESGLDGWRIRYSMGWASSPSWDGNMSEDHQATTENLTRKDQFRPRVGYVEGAFALAWTEIDSRDFFNIRIGYLSRNGDTVSRNHIVDDSISLGTFINDPDIYIAEMVRETTAVIGAGNKAQVFWMDHRTDPNPSNDIAEDSDPYTATAFPDPTIPHPPVPVHPRLRSVSWDSAELVWEPSPDVEFKGYYLTIAEREDPLYPDVHINDGAVTDRLSTHFSFTGLQPDSNYHVRLMTLDHFGNRADSNVITFETGRNSLPVFRFLEPDGVDDETDTGFLISWECSDDEEVASFSIHYDTDLDPSDQVLLINGTTAEGGGIGEYFWNTSSLPSGAYTLNATIYDGVNDPVTVYSPAVMVTHRRIIEDHPRVLSVRVEGGKERAYIDPKITVTFSHHMSPVSIDKDSLYLIGPGNVRVNGGISMPLPDTVIFIPDQPLLFGSSYNLILKHTITDMNGSQLDGENLGTPSPFDFSFTTRSDAGTPEIREWEPQGSDVPLRPEIKIMFDIPMSPSTFLPGIIRLVGPSGEIPLSVEDGGGGLLLLAHPKVPLIKSTTYMVNISSEASSLKGEYISGPFEWTFHTGLPNMDLDSDGDSVPDDLDWFPDDPLESEDSDLDGIGNNADLDDDGDGIPDEWEMKYDLDPLDPSDAGEDPDNDGKTNLEEFRSGSDPRSTTEDESSILIFLIVMIVGVMLILALVVYAVFQRNRLRERELERTFFREE